MSERRFADGLRYRIEIPSVEGPCVLEAVLAEAERRSVPVRRVSQAELVLRLLAERAPELVGGRGEDRPSDLGIPEP